MEEKHDIVAPVFKAKGEPVSKAKISSQPVVKMVKRIPLSSTFASICLYGAWGGDDIEDGFEIKLGAMISCFSSIKSLLTEFLILIAKNICHRLLLNKIGSSIFFGSKKVAENCNDNFLQI